MSIKGNGKGDGIKQKKGRRVCEFPTGKPEE
jgi:hypothetical protein